MSADTQSIQFVKCKSYHGRYGKISNKFTYKVDYVLLPVHKEIDMPTSLIKHNKFGLFSFYDKDHGDGGTIHEFANRILESESLKNICNGPIWLFTQPRCLGYIFNPVSFWYFHDKENNLRVTKHIINIW